MAQELTNKVSRAEKYPKDFKDDFLSGEHLLLAMNDRLDVGSEELMQVLRDVRGSHRVTDQNPEEKFAALEKYGQDLTARAAEGKIDPLVSATYPLVDAPEALEALGCTLTTAQGTPWAATKGEALASLALGTSEVDDPDTWQGRPLEAGQELSQGFA